MSAAVMFTRHLHPVTAAPGRPDGSLDASGTELASSAGFAQHKVGVDADVARETGAADGHPTPANEVPHEAIPTEHGAFVAMFGGVVELSPWVAEMAFSGGPFRDADSLHAAFDAALFAGTHEQQLAVLRAHPELAAKKAITADQLTAESASEQAGAGLDRMAEDRRLALAAALSDYRARFDFPFIACVRDHGGATLEDLVAARLPAEPDAERLVALREVSRIARHRLVDLVDGS